jgi:homospermidine synthase
MRRTVTDPSRARACRSLPKEIPMTTWPVHGRISGPIVMIGFGSIGRGTLPLIERHFEFDRSRIVVIDPVDTDRALSTSAASASCRRRSRTRNYRDILTPLLTRAGGRASA